MGGYNKDKDKVLWESQKSDQSLVIRVVQYGDKGEPKISFSRQFEMPDGEIKEKSGGRLNLQDMTFLGQCCPEAVKVMKKALTDKVEQIVYPDEVDPDKVLSEQGLSVYDEEK